MNGGPDAHPPRPVAAPPGFPPGGPPPYGPRVPQYYPAAYGPEYGPPLPGQSRPPVAPRRPVRPAEAAVTALWRTVVAVLGLAGFAQAPGGPEYLSQLSSLLVGIYYAGLALVPVVTAGRFVDEPDPWLRMSVAVLTWIAGIVFATVLSGDYGDTWSLLEHLIVPLVVLVDTLFAGRNLQRVRWWHILTLPAGGVLYLIFALSRDEPLYKFLDPDNGAFAPTIVGVFAGVLVAGALMWGIGRVRASVGAPRPRYAHT